MVHDFMPGRILAGGFVSGATFLAAEISTQNTIAAGAIAVAGAVIVAVIGHGPKWSQRRADTLKDVITELRRSNSAMEKRLERQIALQNRERALMRSTKHKLAGLVEPAHKQVVYLELVLERHGVPFESFGERHGELYDAFREEDDAMKELTEQQLDAVLRDEEEAP